MEDIAERQAIPPTLQAIGVEYLNENGRLNPVIVGYDGTGVECLLAAAIEQSHDDKSVIFPVPIAPIQVHLLVLNANDPAVRSAADSLQVELEAAGYEMLYNDRVESARVVFNDAGLLGLPVRVVVSPRNLRHDVIELRSRREMQATQVPADGVASAVRELLATDELVARAP